MTPQSASDSRRPTIDIVIPVLDEADRVERAISSALEHPLRRLWVVDGGSKDGTGSLVTSLALAKERLALVTSEAGRSRQMNEGAAKSPADVLLFLHCDVVLPPDALDLIADALLAPDVVGGAFRVRTVPEGPPHWSHRLLWLADLRSRYTSHPYGDQALFVRRTVFESLGGYPEVAILEDLKLSQALAQAGRLVRIPVAVEVSGRRFRERPFATGLMMNVIPALARLGVSPSLLGRLYPPVR